jgi:hypothetical protein
MLGYKFPLFFVVKNLNSLALSLDAEGTQQLCQVVVSDSNGPP